MADEEDFSVKFGASIDEAITGINKVREGIQSVAETTQGLSEGFKTIGELIGVSFAVDKIKEFVASMAEAGEQTERTAAMLGVSTTQAQQLGFIAEETGGSTEGMTLAVERLQVSLQHAQSGTSQQALALKALGLSAKDLIGVPIPEQMDRLADAFSKFADGPNKTAVAMELLGRAGAQMIPVLDQGRAGLDTLSDGAINAGAVMTSQTAAALALIKERTTLLQSSMSALGGTFVALSSKQITDFETSLATTASHMTALASSGMLNEFVTRTLSDAWDLLSARLGKAKTALADFFASADKYNADMAAWDAKIDAIASNSVKATDAIIDRAVANYRKLLAELNGAGVPKPNMPALDVGGGDATKAQTEQFQMAIKMANEQYNQTKSLLDSEAKDHDITYSQETAALLQALADRHTATTVALNDQLALYAKGSNEYKKVLDEQRLDDQKYAADRQKIVQQAAQEEAKEWKTAADQVSSAFNSQLKGLLAGTTTWSQAMKSISADLVLKMIEDQVKVTAEFLAGKTQEVAAALAGETAKTTATTTGAALRSAAEVASGTTSIFSVIGDALAAIGAGAAKTVAGVTGEQAPFVGPLAPAEGAAAGATVFGTALAYLSGFDIGTDYVLSGGLAMIHEGEQIKPARGSGPYTGGADGETHHHYNFNIISQNPRDMARALSDNDGAVMKAVRSAIKKGAHLKP